MARARLSKTMQQDVVIHEDEYEEEEDHRMDESQDPNEESRCTLDDSEEEDEIDQTVLDDMKSFQNSFNEIKGRYRLINRIGEGTFSTVYKAEDLEYDTYKNQWDIQDKENSRWSTPTRKEKRNTVTKRRPHYVAIKKIYVTSSPNRILNELELLHDLRASDSVCPLITAFRHADQVIAILPYFQHRDFRDYFRDMAVPEMRLYFRSLLTALRAVHQHKILHRDIKPTNFLYSPQHARGVLVDFGLAEREGTDWHHCLCSVPAKHRDLAAGEDIHAVPLSKPAYPKNDQRPSRRANRAGTRGFRAPEVLLKCTMQTTAIDMWSVGVILLTLLARRFPFFHSADDIDALLELTNIFGKQRMRAAARLHGQVFETNIPTYTERGFSFDKIVLWCTDRTRKDESGRRVQGLEDGEVEAIRFLERLLECDPTKRITAEEALAHPFIARAGEEESAEEEVDLVSPQREAMEEEIS